MRFLVTLAWKNLLRHTRRTLITASAIAVGLGLFVYLDGFIKGADAQSQRNLGWYESAGVRVAAAGYWDERDGSPLDLAIDDPGPLLEEIGDLGYPATPRTSFTGELIVAYDPFPEDGSLPTRVIGIDPETDGDVYRIDRTITDGRFLQPGEEGVLMGAWTAEDIGAEVGYTVTIATRTRDGYRQTIRVPIVGIFNTPNPVVNRGVLFLDLSVVDYYLEMGGAVTQIDVQLPNLERGQAAGIEFAERLDPGPQYEVITWNDLAAEAIAVAQADIAGSAIIMVLVFVIAAVGVGNTMLMAVFERVRELGMMRALGMQDRQIQLAFVIEAAGVGLIGSTAGLVIGTIGNYAMIRWGIDFGFAVEVIGNVGYRIATVMYGAWNPGTMVIAFVAGIVMSALIAWVPARRVTKMSVTESLVHQ
jgi:ABC-type lipoprotein release transport system permease subunit